MSDQRPNPGRARGRGRARANPDVAQTGGNTAPPGFVKPVSAPAPRQPAPIQAQGPTGDAPSQQRPRGTNGVDKLSTAMGELKVAPSDKTRGGLQRRLRNSIIECNVQPENISEKVGTVGQVVNLVTNFTTLKLPGSDFFVYQIRFSWPLAFSQKMDTLKRLQTSGNLPSGPFAFDGFRVYTTTMWTATEDESLLLQYQAEKTINIRQVSKGVAFSEQHYQLCNIIINNVQVLLGQDRVGRSYFVPSTSTASQQNSGFVPVVQRFEHLSLHGGYETAIQRGLVEGTPLPIMHISKSHRILSQKTALEFLNECGGGYNAPNKTEILGRQVTTKYNNRTYTINDITDDVNISTTFEVDGPGGEKQVKSYEQYFKERYNIQLQHRIQCFIISRPKKRDVQKVRRAKDPEAQGAECAGPDTTVRELQIPSELCYLCGLSEKERMNYQRNRAFNEITKRGPQERVNDVADFQRWINNNKATNSFLKEWDLQMGQEPLMVRGRELPAWPIVSYDPKTQDYTASLAMQSRGPGGGIVRGEWDPKNIKVKSVKEYKLGVLFVQNVSSRNFLSMLSQVSRQMCLAFTELNPDEDIVMLERGGNVGQVLKDFYELGYDIVLVAALRNQDYSMVKMVTVESGLLTQCIVKRNFEDQRKGMSIATKVAIQMACKLGMDAWRVGRKFPHKLRTMVVGMDTYHNKSQKKSIHAAVFSCNQFFTQYINVAWQDSGRQEFNASISSYFRKALDIFSKRTKNLPGRIIIYRDGVSDSQLEHTKAVEIDTLKVTLAEIYAPNPPPHLIVIVVKKRISARFFLTSGGNRNVQNPTPGTVVDTGIVKPNFYEFFAVSQLTRQGTATPTNYNVVEDTLPESTQNNHLTPSEIQDLTLSLTHLYFNWPGTIRVPAPVHYAHRLAFLIGTSLPRFTDLNAKVEDKLFYL